MRKFLFNPGFLSAVASAVGVVKLTRDGPRDWRLALLWVSWGIGVALAVGSVMDQDREVREAEVDRELGL